MKEELHFLKCIDHEVPMQIEIPEEKSKCPAMLLVHGYMSAKNCDGHMLERISSRLVKEGIIAARIDLCSMGENLCSREKYGMRTMIDEVKASFNYLKTLDYVKADYIGLLGHSLGGRLVFTCSTLPAKLIVTLNGAINTEEMMVPSYNKLEMRELGYSIIHTSDGRAELIYHRFEEDMKDTLNNNIRNFKNPILVCIAANDPTLNPKIGFNFVKNCNMNNVDSIVINNANHTFNAKTGDYTKLNELNDKMIPWITKQME